MSMAALIHDIISIQSNGMNIKANFNYTKIDLVSILCLPQLLDTKSIRVDWKSSIFLPLYMHYLVEYISK